MSIDRRVGMKRTTRRVLAALSAAVLVSPCVRAFAGDESPDPAAASSPQIQQWSLEQLLNIDITTVLEVLGEGIRGAGRDLGAHP